MLRLMLLSLSALLFCSTVTLADSGQQRYEPNYENWSFMLGAGIMHRPEYLGSDDFETRALPLFGATYKFDENHQIAIGFPSTAYIYSKANYKTGIELGYEHGRDSDEDELLTGLQDIDPYATLSPFISYTIENIGTIKTKANFDMLDEAGGYTVDLSLERQYWLASNWKLTAEINTSYADREYLDAYFTTAANGAVGRSAYEAKDAGFYQYGVKGSLSYTLDKQQVIAIRTEVNQLTGDAADSSITQEGTQVKISLGYFYRF